MARNPAATWNPKGTTPGGAIAPRVVILHVTAAEGNAQPHDGLEWHFEVFYDGGLEQQVDTDLRADANNKANAFAISVESEGKGDGAWTPAQLETIKRLLLWCRDTHGIPLKVCTDPYGSGVGFHTMFGAPSAWTPVAKSCPGPQRKKQFWDVIVPWMESLEDDVTHDEIKTAVREVLNEAVPFGYTNFEQSFEGLVDMTRDLVNKINAIRAEVADLKARPVASSTVPSELKGSVNITLKPSA